MHHALNKINKCHIILVENRYLLAFQYDIDRGKQWASLRNSRPLLLTPDGISFVADFQMTNRNDTVTNFKRTYTVSVWQTIACTLCRDGWGSRIRLSGVGWLRVENRSIQEGSTPNNSLKAETGRRMN